MFIAIVVLVIVLQELASILRPLALAAFFTILCMPLYDFAKKKKIPAFIPLTGVFIIIIVVSYLLGGLLSSEIAIFESNSDTYQEQIQSTLDSFPLPENIDLNELNVEKIISNQSFKTFISSVINSAGNFFSEIFLAILFAIFMIPAYRKLLQKLIRKNRKLKTTLMKIQTSTVQYLRTKSIISLGTAASSALALALFQSDFVWTLSIILFLFNFIPNIGSFVAVALASLLYLFKFGLGSGFIALVIILITIQMIWGNIIEPYFSGKELKLSPLLILISLFFWGWLWGIGGMLLSVPLLAVLKIILEHFESTKSIAEYMQ